MDTISRRNFVKKASRLTAGIVVMGASAQGIKSCKIQLKSIENMKVCIPMPIQVVIDDVGWWSGEDGSKKQQAYRTGISRNHVPSDYKAIVDLGRKLGIRPQAAFILCEWDKENILRQLPTSTWMGKKWDNSRWVGPWYDEAAQIIRNNQNHFELTLHGIGHEYWEEGTFTRAEWTDSNGQMRPEYQVELHLDYFEKLMQQHNLGPFPKSFVPAAFRHSFGPSTGRNISLAEILIKRGVNYINTPFKGMANKERVQFGLFGFDAGVMTIDRGDDKFPWTSFPGNPFKELTGPTCGVHWPNLLHPDPEKNSEVIENWVNYLKPYNEKADMILAPDSIEFQHQLAHRKGTTVRLKRNSIELDFSETDKYPRLIGKKVLSLKIQSSEALKFKSDTVIILAESLKKETEFLYTLKLSRQEGLIKAEIRVSD